MRCKVLLGVLLVSVCLDAAAQDASFNRAHQRFHQLFNQRVPVRNTLVPVLGRDVAWPVDGSVSSAKGGGSADLPSRRWFPGEWEEVQAVVVAWPYSYFDADVPESERASHMASPLLTGVADIYRYVNDDWTFDHVGPYVACPDTLSGTADDTASLLPVMMHVIDAIQAGEAEAWISIESAADSAVVLRQMRKAGLAMTRYRWICGPRNAFWFRDNGPICFYYGAQDSVGMLDFAYYPERPLDDSLSFLLASQTGLRHFASTLEWEGGNCVVDGAGFCLTSDAVYSANADTVGSLCWNGCDTSSLRYRHKRSLTSTQVRDTLHALIGGRRLAVVPRLRYDGGTGHVDLYADMLDENDFVFSAYPDSYRRWTDYRLVATNIDTLCSYRSVVGRHYRRRTIPFPAMDDGSTFQSQVWYNRYYTRSYSNHTFVNRLIIQPCFSPVVDGQPTADWDRANLQQIAAAYPGYTLYPIDVRAFDGLGGAIHCITKQIPADNPLRILHASLVGHKGADFNDVPITLTARVTNRSGIAGVELHYRIDGGEWRTVAMQSTADAEPLYTCQMEALHVADGQRAVVDYYISATAQNGKTATKPMTALQGGYFTFDVDNGTNDNSEDDPSNGRPSANPDFPFVPHSDTDPLTAVTEADAGQQVGTFYPNPATEAVSIRLSSVVGERCTVQLFDAHGRRLHEASLTEVADGVFTLRTAALPAGVYTVVFASPGCRQVRRFVKM